ncbi:SLA/LP autoantigen protein, putative [Bodo saltans]|uniref:O-phosphoseryl-tRNA(Sec) selenium transferase n=1 Tax=Bodo saltans TaxID=75058 RepID=A0A0S4KH93_BODSA|nr:SLA/LP autoantigen protein, putative [Bodo saltans]|eukprot:CUI11039.1 SLA/LP autoantigen protein, putative [Bodo saltans]
MDETSLRLARQLVTSRYVDAAEEALRTDASEVHSLLAQRRLRDDGMSDALVESLMMQLSLMDSNNFPSRCGAGEREGRVLSSLVSRRHFHMSHGIGRSGDLLADQPKACGSSLVGKIANIGVLDAIRCAGCKSCEDAIVVPMATGMTISLVLQSIRKARPSTARYVLWSRIDQKTSLKCIEAAGLTPLVMNLSPIPSEGSSQSFYGITPATVEEAIQRVGVENIVCVLITTSCFAPRIPDDPLRIGRVCVPHGVPLIVNNAYGLQSPWIMKRLQAAFEHRVVEVMVQSTDKNFLVPVGGAVVAGVEGRVRAVSELYAGRASASQSLDVLMTLLGLGRRGYLNLLASRLRVRDAMLNELATFAKERGEELIVHPHNDISLAVTMRGVADPKSIGGKLFRHQCTGPKVVTMDTTTELCGVTFSAYGSHCDDVEGRCPMLVMACGIGMEVAEVTLLLKKLRLVWDAPTLPAPVEAPTV